MSDSATVAADDGVSHTPHIFADKEEDNNLVPTDTKTVEHSDLDDLSVEELAERESKIHAALVAKQQEQKSAVFAQIRVVMDNYAISNDELIEFLGGTKAKRQNTPAKVKYRDSAGNTWTGRGKPPNWIKDKDRAQFLVAE